MNTFFCAFHDTPMKYYRTHSHDKYEIICCASGSCTTVVDGKSYFLEASDIIIIPPHTSHGATSNIEFTDIYIQAKSINFNKVTTTHDTDGKIFTLMTMLESVLNGKGVNYQKIADSILDTVCACLEQELNQKYKHPFTGELKNMILEGFGNPDFDLSECIRSIGYNKDYLRRCFEYDIGKSPLEYLTELRINKAKELLLQSDFESVANVALRCGFYDSLYFSTCFKKHTHLSPMAYRKKSLTE